MFSRSQGTIVEPAAYACIPRRSGALARCTGLPALTPAPGKLTQNGPGKASTVGAKPPRSGPAASCRSSECEPSQCMLGFAAPPCDSASAPLSRPESHRGGPAGARQCPCLLDGSRSSARRGGPCCAARSVGTTPDSLRLAARWAFLLADCCAARGTTSSTPASSTIRGGRIRITDRQPQRSQTHPQSEAAATRAALPSRTAPRGIRPSAAHVARTSRASPGRARRGSCTTWAPGSA